MQGRELLMAFTHGQCLCRLDESLHAVGVFFNVHSVSLSLPFRPEGTDLASSMGFRRRH
jgi:hypothetical protein